MRKDYVHVDISDQWTETQKLIVALFFVTSIISIHFVPKRFQCWVTLGCGISMVLIRVLQTMGDNLDIVFTNLGRFPTEPVVFLASFMFLKACLQEYFPAVTITIQRSQVFGKSITSQFLLISLLSMIMGPEAALTLVRTKQEHHHSQNTTQSKRFFSKELILTFGAYLGGSLSFLSSTAAFLAIYCYAYDEVTWPEFARDMVFPVTSLLATTLPAVVAVDRFVKDSEVEEDPITTALTETEENLDTFSIPEQQPYLEVSNIPASASRDEENTGAAESSQASSDQSSSLLIEQSSTSPHSFDHSILVGWTKSPFLIMVAYVLLLGILFPVGANVLVVLAVTTTLIMFVGRTCFSNLPWYLARTLSNPLFHRLEFSDLVFYVGMMLLCIPFADSAIFPRFYSHLMGDCLERVGYLPSCMLKHAGLNYLLGLLLSPLATAILLASIYPYFAPYYWIQISFHLTMATGARRLAERVWEKRQHHKFWMVWALGSGAIPCLYVLAGTRLISKLHMSKECSERLGECGY